MRSDPPVLLPILRSRHQAELLTLLVLRPDQDHTLSELARILDVPASTLHREVQRLEEADLVTAREVGRSRLLRVNVDNRLVPPLTELLTIAFGPHLVIREEFSNLPGTDIVLIYGSWAERFHGTRGALPRDVDVLVVGSPPRSDVYYAADRAQHRLGLPVHPTLASARRWRDSSDGLIQQIRATHVVTIFDRTK